MHVLYVIDGINGSGGSERSLISIAPEYAKRGIRLSVACLHERRGLQEAAEASGVALHWLSGGGGRAGWLRRVTKLVGELGPDLVHTTLFESDLAGRIAGAIKGIPVVSSLVSLAHGPEHRNPGLALWKLRGAQLADAATARLVTRFHAVGTTVADAMAVRLRIAPSRIDVVPRGRDPRVLGERTIGRRSLGRRMLGLVDGQHLVLAVGRHAYQKGLDILVEAIPALTAGIPGVRVCVAGHEARETCALRAQAERLGLDWDRHFLGPRSDVADLLCAADVFVLPSRSEGFSNVILEAMALGTPIVATDLPAVREAVSDGETARLFRPCDPSALARTVASVIADPEWISRSTAKGRAVFLERYTIDRVADGMHALYERALESSSPWLSRARPKVAAAAAGDGEDAAAAPDPAPAGKATMSPCTEAHSVSIVIPTCNRPELVRRAVSSALTQDGVEVEVIVVDNGSSTPVAPMDDPRVRILCSRGALGPSAARNLGLSAATREWVTFLDDDDELLPQKTARSLAAASAFTGRDPVAVMTGVRIVGTDGGVLGATGIDAHIDRGNPVELQRLPWQMHATIVAPTGMLRAIGGFDPELHAWEHADLLIRLNDACALVALSDALYQILEHPGQRQHNDALASAQGIERTLAKHAHVFAHDRRRRARWLESMGMHYLAAGRRRQAIAATGRAVLCLPRPRHVACWLVTIGGMRLLALARILHAHMSSERARIGHEWTVRSPGAGQLGSSLSGIAHRRS